jgi:hypothetical protein
LHQLLGRAARLSRKAKLQIAAAAAAVLTLAACYTWGDRHALPYHTVDSAVTGEIRLGSDDRTITLAADWGPCNYEPDLVARESADQVALILRQKDFSGPGIGCDGGGVARISTRLSRPLGARRVVDAVTGKPVPILRA